MEGWVKLHRKALNNPIVNKDADHMYLWIYLLLNATHKKYDVLFKGERITLQPGQLLTGRKSISSFTKISEGKIQRILKFFENEQQIEQQTSNKNRLISIVSWDMYQQSEQQNEQQVNNKWTTSEQQVNTNKNVRSKECKNVKNDDVSASAEIFNFYNNNFGLITNFEAESIGTFLDDGVEVALIIKAMQIAIENKVRNWGYVKKILQNKLDAGVKTIEQFNQFEKEREFKKEKKTLKFNKVDQLNNFDQRHYDEEDLEQYYS